MRRDLQVACPLAPGLGERESRRKGGGEHEPGKAASRTEIENCRVLGQRQIERFASGPGSERYGRDAIYYMEDNFRRVGRGRGQVGMRTPQGQGGSHLFDPFEKAVARAQCCSAQPSRYPLAHLVRELLDIGFT